MSLDVFWSHLVICSIAKRIIFFFLGKLLNWPPLILTVPIITKKKIAPFIRFLVLKMISLPHGVNAKIGLEKYSTGAEILAKTSQNMHVCFGNLDFVNFG